MTPDVGTGALRPPTPSSAPTAPLSFGGPSGRLALPRWMVLVILLVAQAAFARAMISAPSLGVVQVLAVTGLAVWSALRRATTASICLIAYIPGMEICLRQNHAPAPYLVAPYLLILISVLAIFTVFNQLTKPGRTALYYFALLLPSCIVTITMAGDNAREPIAFALAGPASLAVMVVFFSQVRLQLWLYRRLLWVFLISGIAPIAVAATSISDYLATGATLGFSNESNFATSGGFGPVQVSSVMGLGVVLGVLAAIVERDLAVRLLAVLMAVIAATMSFLTFSRGGMTAAALAIGAFVIANTTDRESRKRVILIVTVAIAVGYLFLIPWLNSFTQGGFQQRFSDTDTERTELAKSDIEIFQSHLLFGVGPGMTRYQRLTYEICQIRQDRCKDEGSSHTEFTRMLSEHGIGGLVAIGFLAWLPVQAVRRAGRSRPITVAFMTWAIAQMFYANFRVSAVAVAFAFAFLRIDLPARKGASDEFESSASAQPLRVPRTLPG